MIVTYLSVFGVSFVSVSKWKIFRFHKPWSQLKGTGIGPHYRMFRSGHRRVIELHKGMETSRGQV